MSKKEHLTCPRRGEGPGFDELNADEWETDRWFLTKEDADKYHDEYRKAHKSNITFSENGDLWLWDWGPPRTCSYCGGIHPEDCIKLILEGWEVEATGKYYKRYLNPPGSKIRMQAMLKSIKEREPGVGVPSVWSPTPPVKSYIQHYTQEQVERFNKAIESTK